MGRKGDLIDIDTDDSDQGSDIDIDEAIAIAAEVEQEELNSEQSKGDVGISLGPLVLQEDALSQHSSLEFSSTLIPPAPPPPPPHALLTKAIELLKFPTLCRVCRRVGAPAELLICTECGKGAIFHDECWSKEPQHAPDSGPAMWEPCEKVPMLDYAWMTWLFNSNISPGRQKSLHKKDLWTTWFGVPYHQYKASLYTYPRLQSLLSKSDPADMPPNQYPSLISFFGDTGGGKSTLISSLIRNTGPKGEHFDAPVPGNLADMEKSTSGDVHLYADPRTVSTEVPLFYADCEGLRGNHRSVAAELASNPRTELSPLQRQTLRGVAGEGLHRTYAEEVREHRKSARQLPLQWGRVARVVMTGPYGPQEVEPPHIDYATSKSVVTELYPRLLYTFSDVVCFITNNVKATESDIMELFRWAASGHERTTNQRIRPALIIIVNKLPAKANPEWLDVDFSTDRLLGQFHLSGAFSELTTQWASRGRTLKTAKDLIECYYDSFRVVCMPDLVLKDPKTAMLLSRQLNVLYQEIRMGSARLRQKRLKVGMNLDTESFNTYVDHAFNRLSKELKAPIDFYFLASKDPVIPSKMSEHLVSVITKMLQEGDYSRSNELGQESALISRLIPYIASCIVMQISPETKLQDKHEKIDAALDEVQTCLHKCRERHWRCEAKDHRGRRCINHWDGHEKGHQTLGMWKVRMNSDSSIPKETNPQLQVGPFQHQFEPDAVMRALAVEVAHLMELEPGPRSMMLSQSARSSGVAALRSNRTCLTCLANCPVYILPCTRRQQHTICETCADRFSTTGISNGAILTLMRCPLDCPFEVTPWRIRRKPPQAGVRILALDGGGIRGVVELRILQNLMAKVGHKIPIQELFDLAVGTSTGGIIALGLFKMDWSLEQAIRKFHELVQISFDPRQALKVPGFKNVAQLFCSWRYESAGIETALKTAFGKDELFAQKRNAVADRVKVAVVAGVQGTNKISLFSNYSRNPTKDDRLVRSDDPDDDFKTWQAGRATSAAPIYFQPYYHEETRRYYIDGALRRNNPVQLADEERSLIWKENKRSPDIVLSVGTGVQTTMLGVPKQPNAFSKRETLRRLLPRGIRKNVATAYDMVQSTLNCETAWEEFKNSHRHDSNFTSVCYRLNVRLQDKPPKMDNVGMMLPLESQAKSWLNESPVFRQRAERVAARLLASLFYFVEDVPEENTGTNNLANARTIRGQVECRLSPNMEGPFASIIDAGVSFRVCDKDGQRDVTSPIFNRQTFSSDQVEFLVSPGSKEWHLEIMFHDRDVQWQRLSGFC